MQILEEILAAFKSGRKLTPRELLYYSAVNHLGTDASPLDEAPDVLACVDSVEEIYHAVFNRYIGDVKTLSTWVLEGNLRRSPQFVKVDIPEFGDIIISPTRGKITGHVGIVGKDEMIFSNNSFGGVKGLFTANYTLSSWMKYFSGKGLSSAFYRRI